MTITVNKNRIIKSVRDHFVIGDTFDIDFPYAANPEFLEVFIVNDYGFLLDTWTDSANYSITNLVVDTNPNIYGRFTYNVNWDLEQKYGVYAVNVIVKRSVPILQQLPFSEQLLIADTTEKLMDQLTMELQDVALSSAIKLPESDFIDSASLVLPGAAERAVKVIGFNETGTQIKLFPNSSATANALCAPETDPFNPTFTLPQTERSGKILAFNTNATTDVNLLAAGQGIELNQSSSSLNIKAKTGEHDPLEFQNGALNVRQATSGTVTENPVLEYHPGNLGVVRGGPFDFTNSAGEVNDIDSNVYISDDGGMWSRWYKAGEGITIARDDQDGDYKTPHTVKLNYPHYDNVTHTWSIGGVKPDGTTTTVDSNGTISATQAEPYQLPTASAIEKGGVKIGAGLTMNGEILNNTNPTPYSLQTASDTTKGGVMTGGNIYVDSNAIIHADIPKQDLQDVWTPGAIYPGEGLALDPNSLEPSGKLTAVKATADDFGIVKPDNSTITFTQDGTLTYILPHAGSGAQGNLGGIKIGQGFTYHVVSGVLDNANPTPYTLLPASTDNLGGVIIGENIEITAGVIDAKIPHKRENNTWVPGTIFPGQGLALNPDVQGELTAAKATADDFGIVKPDGTTITIDNGVITSTGGKTYTGGDGIAVDDTVISLKTASSSQKGGVKVGSGLTITQDGTLSSNATATSENTLFKGLNGITINNRDYAVIDYSIIPTYQFITSITLGSNVFILSGSSKIYYRPVDDLTGWVDVSLDSSFSSLQNINYMNGCYSVCGLNILLYRYSFDSANPWTNINIGSVPLGECSFAGIISSIPGNRIYAYGGRRIDGADVQPTVVCGYSPDNLSVLAKTFDRPNTFFIDGKLFPNNSQNVPLLLVNDGTLVCNPSDQIHDPAQSWLMINPVYPDSINVMPSKIVVVGTSVYILNYGGINECQILYCADFSLTQSNTFVLLSTLQGISANDFRYHVHSGLFTVAVPGFIYSSHDAINWKIELDSTQLGFGLLNFVAANMGVGLCFSSNGVEFKYENGRWISNPTYLNSVDASLNGYANSADLYYEVAFSSKVTNEGNYIYYNKGGLGWQSYGPVLLAASLYRVRWTNGPEFMLMGYDGQTLKALLKYDVETQEMTELGLANLVIHDYGRWTIGNNTYEICSGTNGGIQGFRIFWKLTSDPAFAQYFASNVQGENAITAALGGNGNILIWCIRNNVKSSAHIIPFAKSDQFPNGYVNHKLPFWDFSSIVTSDPTNAKWVDIDYNGQFFLLVREGGGLARVVLDENYDIREVQFLDKLAGVTGILSLQWDKNRWVVTSNNGMYVSHDIYGEDWDEVPFYNNDDMGTFTWGELDRSKDKVLLGMSNMGFGIGVRKNVFEIGVAENAKV